jgi:hypothetical protein
VSISITSLVPWVEGARHRRGRQGPRGRLWQRSIAAWEVAPGESVVGLDLDLSVIAVRAANLELRRRRAGDREPHRRDRPRLAILPIEPDFLSVSVAAPPVRPKHFGA